MNTITIKKKISSPYLHISELKDFIGKIVEITVKESTDEMDFPSKMGACGILSAFNDQNKISLEKQAWETVVIEKHGNS